jgi:hypothetical protein
VHGAVELPELDAAVAELSRGFAQPFPECIAAMADGHFRRLGADYLAKLRRHVVADRVVDKMPANYLFVGLIHLALPRARIVHVRRDPVDTSLSCYTKLFTAGQDHTYDLAELGRYYRKYAELMDHWRMVLPAGRTFELRYEELIADPEATTRALLAHCGLPWHARCLAFNQHDRVVRTASASQVRQPIYRTSQRRSLAYREHLRPLVEALGDLASPA